MTTAVASLGKNFLSLVLSSQVAIKEYHRARSVIGYKRDAVWFRMLSQILFDGDSDAPERKTYRETGERILKDILKITFDRALRRGFSSERDFSRYIFYFSSGLKTNKFSDKTHFFSRYKVRVQRRR